MKNITRFLGANKRMILVLVGLIIVLGGLMLYRLGSLTGGISPGEARIANATYGWSGLYHNPFYLPINFVRSIIYWSFQHHGQLLTRLPSTFFGVLAIISLGWLLRLWHGRRTALMGAILFATGAWTLHVSRLASNEVVYLAALPVMLLLHVGLQRLPERKFLFYANILLFSLLLYVPGMIWLVALNIFWMRDSLKDGWLNLRSWWQRVLAVAAGLLWLPLVAHLTHPHQLQAWLGLPQHLASPLTILQQIGEVFVHLFIRGPLNPELWLGRAPLLDIFTLLASLVGLYWYAKHWKAGRSRMIGSFLVLGAILIGLGGPVGLSLVVPLAYICAAAGISFLLREWFQVFPLNPIARGIGIGVITVLVIFACFYNLRAYFIAWPHNEATQATFRIHR